MNEEYDGCPACGRASAEAKKHCENERCGHIECPCSRIYDNSNRSSE